MHASRPRALVYFAYDRRQLCVTADALHKHANTPTDHVTITTTGCYAHAVIQLLLRILSQHSNKTANKTNNTLDDVFGVLRTIIVTTVTIFGWLVSNDARAWLASLTIATYHLHPERQRKTCHALK
eukprot:scaffold112_cov57-Attheya_sp.AAC.5